MKGVRSFDCAQDDASRQFQISEFKFQISKMDGMDVMDDMDV
ncbi:MAG: hypothetical protein ABSB91_01945 [Sedimentisphaerales bacterium]